MLGKTHFAVGMASALAILQPQTLPVLITGTAAAAVGGWWLLRLIFGRLLSRTGQPLILLLLVFLYLACYGAALLLCGALRREELSWLFSLLRGEKSPKT